MFMSLRLKVYILFVHVTTKVENFIVTEKMKFKQMAKQP